jgi:hypothetical protein
MSRHTLQFQLEQLPGHPITRIMQARGRLESLFFIMRLSAMPQCWIGIDVSQKRLDVYIRPTNTVFSYANQADEIAQLVERLKTASLCRGDVTSCPSSAE